MSKFRTILLIVLPVAVFSGMNFKNHSSSYFDLYLSRLTDFHNAQQMLAELIEKQNELSPPTITILKNQIATARLKLKNIDFWLRYLEPVAYKKINGPLPIEWETEVFEKFEKPYKRDGAGLTLAELYLDEPNPQKDSLLHLLSESNKAIETFRADSITRNLAKPDHFFYANRLFLLNLSAVYTTGFENPNPDNIVSELLLITESTKEIYSEFGRTFPSDSITSAYFQLYNKMGQFISSQDKNPDKFDNFHFIKDYVNPLYTLNQHFIEAYKVYSKNYNDYSLNNGSSSIFDKNLYKGQNRKGIYIGIDEPETLEEIKAIGKMLFFDPILSGNGKRSCASCHKPKEYFTDTAEITSLKFNETGRLPRNTPSLLNVVYNHLLMLDGKHISLQNQAKDVITNPNEMGCDAQKMLDNVLSCDTYRKAFQKFRKLTPNYDEITADHIVSAITLYYADFSDFTAPFDRAMNNIATIDNESIEGFNLFMSKAKCATCHFVPQFNGVKPPYISSEFEILGVPSDTTFKYLSSDSGRYKINPATETLRAIRTGSIRNSTFTKPYMHNGVFNSMKEVIDFYDAGGGIGKGLKVDHQTLPADSLHLTTQEKKAIIAFMKTLDENIIFPDPPSKLPSTNLEPYKKRKPGGVY